ncbi:MAG: hypothetical protein E7436_08750 [Ruminococcaceae bacterium]|nr:hypothetical protein [Oscillospiraceae bacterium]
MTQQEEQLLASLTLCDEIYQSTLSECLALETEYLRIVEQLPPQDRALLEHYIALCEELEYRRTDIALHTKMDSLG